MDAFKRHGVAAEHVDVAWVPGSFELPVVAKAMAKSGKYDGVICIGVVVSGGHVAPERLASLASRMGAGWAGRPRACSRAHLTCPLRPAAPAPQVRGATAHYDAVVGGATSGVLNASTDSGVPVIFGVLTCDTMEQVGAAGLLRCVCCMWSLPRAACAQLMHAHRPTHPAPAGAGPRGRQGGQQGLRGGGDRSGDGQPAQAAARRRQGGAAVVGGSTGNCWPALGTFTCHFTTAQNYCKHSTAEHKALRVSLSPPHARCCRPTCPPAPAGSSGRTSAAAA